MGLGSHISSGWHSFTNTVEDIGSSAVHEVEHIGHSVAQVVEHPIDSARQGLANERQFIQDSGIGDLINTAEDHVSSAAHEIEGYASTGFNKLEDLGVTAVHDVEGLSHKVISGVEDLGGEVWDKTKDAYNFIKDKTPDMNPWHWIQDILNDGEYLIIGGILLVILFLPQIKGGVKKTYAFGKDNFKAVAPYVATAALL